MYIFVIIDNNYRFIINIQQIKMLFQLKTSIFLSKIQIIENSRQLLLIKIDKILIKKKHFTRQCGNSVIR